VAKEIGIAEEFFGVLLSTERASKAELNAYQTGLLSQLLAYAHSAVPFFAKRGPAPVVADPQSDDWRAMPLMSRRDLTESADDLRTRDLPSLHGVIAPTFTGGSTGKSARRDLSALESLARFGASYRMLHAWQLDQSRDLCWLRKPRPQSAATFDRWGHPWRPLDQLGRRHPMDIASPATEQLALIERTGSAYVHTLPSNMLRLTLEAKRNGPRPAIANFLSVGEYLPPEVRRAATEVFGATTIDVFSSAEGGVTAIQCSESPLYHVQSEIVLVEILKSDGTEACAGETGELVVTPLYSYATPIIRYRTGDFVERGPDCPCGRCLPTIARIVGRREHMFSFDDGRSALPEIDRVAVTTVLGHDRWVFVQTGIKQAEVRVADTLSSDRRRKVLALAEDALKTSFTIAVVEVDALPLTSGSKRHFTLNAIPR
jgi:phenylacetate-CoA ligase